MIQKDKAKAYDEALERARKQRDDYQKELDKTDKNSQLADLLRSGISATEMIFPQLRESEDERIRKELIEYHKQQFENNRDQEVGLFHNAAIAYLEKQKEQEQEWSEEDKEKIVTISEIIEHCTTIPYSGGTLTLNKEYKKELLCFIKSLRPSWKPSEEQMTALETAIVRCQMTGLESLFEELKKL